MLPRLSPWLIPLLVPMAMWHRLRGSPFLVQVLINYAATAARVGSWFVVAGLVYRRGGPDELAILMLLRGTVGLLTYLSFGLTPAMVPLLAKPMPVVPEPDTSDRVDYERQAPDLAINVPRRVLATGFVLALIGSCLAVALGWIYANNLDVFHSITLPRKPPPFLTDPRVPALLIAAGVAMRLLSDIPAAHLHANRKIGRDSLCLILVECVFVACTWFLSGDMVAAAASAFFAASLVQLVGRGLLTLRSAPFTFRDFDPRLVRVLLLGGSFVMLSQIADWLYAPANQILIDRFLGTHVVADYVPAIQIDGALLLLVSGLSTVLFPYTATAFHHQKWNDLRFYYLFGTIFSLIILTIGAVVVCWIDGWLFTKWFGDPLPATQAILPWVMIHTVVGGSASIGRSVLFGMNRIKPYAISAIVGGVANVALAILFLTTTDLGLKGIILATVITVTLRCLIWMPIYTMWSIRQVGGPFRIHWH